MPDAVIGTPTAATHGDPQAKQFWPLTLGAIGVVYGDIGTSPIYAFREAAVAAAGSGAITHDTVLGLLSLILWSLLLVVTLKYVLVLLRADINGEGGTFALMALAQSVGRQSKHVILLLGIAGASFLYGDAVITPAISVLSAVEGLKLISPLFEKVVLALTILILIALFAVQSRGTARVAAFFGPIVLIWFLAIAVAGAVHIVTEPSVLAAFDPIYGGAFLVNNGLIGLTALGLVFLAVTGAEALYADLGHFGRRPIQAAWLALALPALTINYFGQGALLLAHPDTIENPFFRMFPSWSLWPIVVLSTMATIIASQAVITGAYSITRQAVQLGLLPRFSILHTSESVAGQIYLPRVNGLLLVAVLLITAIFQNSSALAAAYGVAVTATMIVTSVMAFFVIWKVWRWKMWQAVALIAPLLLIEQVFFAANVLKIFEGAWVPLAIAISLITVMLTWMRGTSLLNAASQKQDAALDWLVRKLEQKPPHRVTGTAVFLTVNPSVAPKALLHNLKHNRALHERNIILTIRTADVPRVANGERVKVVSVSDTFKEVTLTYGFMETPNLSRGLVLCRKQGLQIDPTVTSFFLSRRNLRPAPHSPMPRWQEMLFIWLADNAEDATAYFQIPADRVVEIGTQVAI
jgi:KUP system potassium uptake protein